MRFLEKFFGLQPKLRCRICRDRRKREEVIIAWNERARTLPIEEIRHNEQAGWRICFGCAEAIRSELEREEAKKNPEPQFTLIGVTV